MPSKSAAQAAFMRAAAHNAKFASKAKISQAVAREFVKADQRKKGKKK
jgi:DNA-binding cell septation regulator SpoVG